MLGWLKRKTPPVAGEPSRRGEDGPASGEERLERLLGRLGSDAVGAGEQAAAAVLERQPRREPAAPTAVPVSAPPPAERRVADDPADKVLNELYPPGASRELPVNDPEEAVLDEIYPPSAGGEAASEREAVSPLEAEPDTADPDTADPVAADQSAAEAAAVIADIDRIVTGDVTPDPITVAAPAEEGEPQVDAIPPAEAAEPQVVAAPGPELAAAPSAAEEAEPPPTAVAAEPPPPAATVEAAEAEMPAEFASTIAEPKEATDKAEPPATVEPRSPRRRAAKKLAGAEPRPSGGGVPPAELSGAFPPMLVIAVASQKGGAGKTTLAAHLAVRAGIAGQGPVVLIDTDPQGSLAEWWHARQDDTPALAVVKPEQLGANLAELRGYGTAVAIIDTPPALTGSIEQVIAMSDLIVIPVRPSPHDLRAAGGTVAMAQRAGKPFIFVVNGASPRASITAQAVAALSEHGRVAPVILYQRTEFAASMIDGRTVLEASASGRSAQEIAELWQCVYAQIGMRAAA